MNLKKRLAALLLVLCMAISLVGCGDTTWIAEIDGETVPSGLYIYFQTDGYGDALYQLYQEDDSYLMQYLYYYNYRTVMPEVLTIQLSSGETVEEHMNSYALDMCKQTVVVERLFDELGLSISPEDRDVIDAQLRNEWTNNGDMWEKAGVSQDSLKLALESHYKEDAVFDAYYEIGGINGTTEEEIENYFADNYARVKYMTFTFADDIDAAVDETRKSEQLELANSFADRANAGESMDDLIKEHNDALAAENAEETEEDSEADTEEESDDEVLNAEIVDEYANESVFDRNYKYPTEKFVSYVFNNCETGTVSVIQDDLCFYVVQRLDVLERDDLYDNYRDVVLQDLFDSDYTKLINDRLAGYSVEENVAAVKRYKAINAFPDAEEN